MKKGNKHYFLLRFFLLVLFIQYIAVTTFFTHTHIVNGRVIVHSHPSGSKEHTHTEKGFYLIDFITHIISTDDVLPLFPIKGDNILLQVLNNDVNVCNILLSCSDNTSLRAPPIFSF